MKIRDFKGKKVADDIFDIEVEGIEFMDDDCEESIVVSFGDGEGATIFYDADRRVRFVEFDGNLTEDDEEHEDVAALTRVLSEITDPKNR
ncbi:hypothetical protein [[Clostridium] aminophilum]|uniref:DUF1292 domain-containing protein n=1 Tax=[Clostridium] aminophilum TaxID=1526 RepID=A0A1I6II43_9FIRM|nr:hypothetical protein [[Clostridium] aminophilum]SFR66358.1 hypothetical protein SAMN02910262_00378 [[Clostridium] aminophilum]